MSAQKCVETVYDCMKYAGSQQAIREVRAKVSNDIQYGFLGIGIPVLS